MSKPAKRDLLVTKTYYNSHTEREELIDLKYTLQNGFCSLDDAIARVESYGYDKTQFLYVRLGEQYFPVGMSSFSEEVIIFYDK